MRVYCSVAGNDLRSVTAVPSVVARCGCCCGRFWAATTRVPSGLQHLGSLACICLVLLPQYTPQALLNMQRRSTDGWSIDQVGQFPTHAWNPVVQGPVVIVLGCELWACSVLSLRVHAAASAAAAAPASVAHLMAVAETTGNQLGGMDKIIHWHWPPGHL